MSETLQTTSYLSEDGARKLKMTVAGKENVRADTRSKGTDASTASNSSLTVDRICGSIFATYWP